MWTRYEEEDPKYPLKPQVWTRPKLLQRSPVSPKFAPSISDILVPRIWNARTQPGDAERPVVNRKKTPSHFGPTLHLHWKQVCPNGERGLNWSIDDELGLDPRNRGRICQSLPSHRHAIAGHGKFASHSQKKFFPKYTFGFFLIFSLFLSHHSPFWCCFDGSFCNLVQLQVLLGYLGALALLGIVLPGPTISGALLADKTRLQYKCNGKSIFLVNFWSEKDIDSC